MKIVRRSALALALLACVAAPAHAQSRHRSSEADPDVIDRQPLRSARAYVLSEDRIAALLLTDRTVILQLTDRGLREIQADMDDDAAEEAEDGLFARLVSGFVRNTVSSFLDHGLAYDLRDLRSATYRDGTIVIEDCSGEEVFGDIQINDEPQQFSRAEAHAFIRRFNQARAQAPSCEV